MTSIYELYDALLTIKDALLTIKDYCASKDNTCEGCPLIDCCIFIKETAPSN